MLIKRICTAVTSIGLCSMLLFGGNMAFADSSSNGSNVSVSVDGKLIKSDVSAYLDTMHSRVMVPVRFVSEALGSKVVWDSVHNVVLINTTSLPSNVTMQESIQIIINGQIIKSDVSPVLQNNHVFVPLRVIVEALNGTSTWNQDANNVQITSQNKIEASQVSTLDGFQANVFARGTSAMFKPDDNTILAGHLFVTFQNGVGPSGDASKTGITSSTIAEYENTGNMINSWNVVGRCDGLTADPANNRVLATVNEDGNSSMYIINPDAAAVADQLQHITYSPDPQAASTSGSLATGGGTDSIAIHNGNIYLTASAPSPDASGNFSHTAMFKATIQGNIANLQPVFMDNAIATDAVTGKPVTLNLSDPDSSNTVTSSVYKYGGSLVLDSQGDKSLVFVSQPGTINQTLTQLSVGTQVDDVAFASSTNGTLYVSDLDNNKVYAITGNFTSGTAFVACPSDSGVGGLVGTLDLSTGNIKPFLMGIKNPKGLTFVPQSN